MKNLFTVWAFGIILDEENRVLLCHRTDYDIWNLPWGGLNIDEAPWDCVVREIKEEVGLDVEVINLVGIYSRINKADIAFSFICRVIGWEISLSDEANQIEYFSLDEIPRNTSPSQVERIKDFLEKKDDNPIMKIQSNPSSIDLIKQGKL